MHYEIIEEQQTDSPIFCRS